MRFSRFAAVGCSLLASLALAPRALAFDLTGTWNGSYVCQGFDGATFKSGNKLSVLLISQAGNTFNAVLDGGDYHYNGGGINALADPDEKGEVVMSQCGTDPVPLQGAGSEIIRLVVKVNEAKGTGSLKGIGIFETAVPDVITCKYKFKRTSTTNPIVLACPAA